MVEPILCHAQNPWRAPDWQWHRAVQIVDGLGLPTTRRRDGDVPTVTIRQLIRFHREQRRIAAMESPQAQLAAASLMEDFPEICWAHMLYSTAERQSARWAMEARILARQTDLQIAASNRCPVGLVQTYAAIFFDVRADLDRTEYILHSVFGDALYVGLDRRDYGTLWKLLGYFGGPQVIDAMTNRCIKPTRAKGAGDVPAFFRNVVCGALKQKAAIAALTAQIDSHSSLPLIGAFAQFLELEQAVDAESSESSQILSNVSTMMGILGKAFRVGSNVGALKSSPIGEDREHYAVEFNGDELLRIANGHPVADLDELSNLKFPEPSSPI